MSPLRSARFWLAGPAALVLAVVLMLGMVVWLPAGRAQIDNIVIPMIVFPLIWAVLFFYAYLALRIARVAVVFAALLVAHIGILAVHLLG